MYRPVVVMRLRNQMAASDNEHQLKYLVYMLEQASKLAAKTGPSSLVVVSPILT